MIPFSFPRNFFLKRPSPDGALRILLIKAGKKLSEPLFLEMLFISFITTTPTAGLPSSAHKSGVGVLKPMDPFFPPPAYEGKNWANNLAIYFLANPPVWL